MKVMRDGRPVTVEVRADGAGLVSHAGTALLARVADELGFTRALSLWLAGLEQRRRRHDPGRVIRDLAQPGPDPALGSGKAAVRLVCDCAGLSARIVANAIARHEAAGGRKRSRCCIEAVCAGEGSYVKWEALRS